MTRKILYFLPLLVVAVLLAFFVIGLQRDPRVLPSVLLERPVPDFTLPGLPDRGQPLADKSALMGEVTLLNFFGSWCVACIQEHPMLKRIQAEGIAPVHGIAFKEDPEKLARWLARHGDPYDRIGYDTTNRIAIEFGVTGAPETFIIDKAGVIRHKHVGPITEAVWVEDLRPRIEKLSEE